MTELFANNKDPDQMPHSAASDLGLHCLPITLLGVSRLQWVKLYEMTHKKALHRKENDEIKKRPYRNNKHSIAKRAHDHYYTRSH